MAEIKENLLRGLVFGRFGTISNFAERLGWSKRKTNCIVNRRQDPTAPEIIQMADALGITVSDQLREIFFNY